ncbi:MAG: hypothetical protein JEZ08_01850 [Clostridiales bacterium]|nr:hypothetical protein [Clostridiales bacterium]
MNKNFNNIEALSKFGLNVEQTRILFSIQYFVVSEDIKSEDKTRSLKTAWLCDWKKSVEAYLGMIDDDSKRLYLDYDELNEAVAKEIYKNATNVTWYYIVMLESTVFTPYTPLSISDGNANVYSKDFNKRYTKLKYKNDLDQLERIVSTHGIISKEYIKTFDRQYRKTLEKISGKKLHLLIKAITVLAVAGVATTLTTIFAGPIAVMIFGSQFSGLTGVALVNACLAAAGGGAIAVGGAGMLGGTIAIAGGGAILSMAVSGVAVGSLSLLLSNSPEFALTQAAKLEVVLREIVCNAQNDIVTAQQVLKQYKQQIIELNTELKTLELASGKNKVQIENLKTAVNYLEKAYNSTKKFVSCYDIGLKTDKDED